MPTSRSALAPRSRRSIAFALTALLVLGACSSDGEDTAATTTVDTAAAYCDAWTGVISAFEAYDEIDVVAGGTDSIQTYFDDLDAAATQLADAADAQLAPAVDAFTTALDDLGTTITSPDLPVDRREEVQAAADDVDAAWNQMVAAFEAGCPDVTATTTPT